MAAHAAEQRAEATSCFSTTLEGVWKRCRTILEHLVLVVNYLVFHLEFSFQHFHFGNVSFNICLQIPNMLLLEDGFGALWLSRWRLTLLKTCALKAMQVVHISKSNSLTPLFHLLLQFVYLPNFTILLAYQIVHIEFIQVDSYRIRDAAVRIELFLLLNSELLFSMWISHLLKMHIFDL